MTTICSAKELSYSIDGKQILNSQSFILKDGDFLEIRGKNGSGKSTLLKILCRVIDNSSLQTTKDFKKNLSYLGHKNAFVEELTMQENFNLDNLKCDISLAKLLNIQNYHTLFRSVFHFVRSKRKSTKILKLQFIKI